MLARVLTRGLLAPGRSQPYLRYALLGQHRVDGWLSSIGIKLVDAADAYQRELDVRGHVAEIGVHHGRLLILLSLLRRPEENALAIDVFEDQHLNVDGSGQGDRARLAVNLRRWDPRHADVRIEQADSWTLDGPALERLAGGRVRLVSIDGGHTAQLTEHDLTTAAGALSDGGLIVLDDLFNELFPGVSEGAQRFFHANPGLQPVIAGGNKTIICQGHYVDRYRARYKSIFADWLAVPWILHENEFLGRPMLSVRAVEGRWAAQYWGRYLRGRIRSLVSSY
jgi:hypothetical protein